MDINFRAILAAAFICIISTSIPALADTVMPALQTGPAYFVPSDSLYGVDLGCFASEGAAADAYVALVGQSTYGKCNANFAAWTSSWPV